MSNTQEKLQRARTIVEGDPKLKRTYQAFKESFNYSEEEALTATLGHRFDEAGDLLGCFGGNR